MNIKLKYVKEKDYYIFYILYMATPWKEVLNICDYDDNIPPLLLNKKLIDSSINYLNNVENNIPNNETTNSVIINNYKLELSYEISNKEDINILIVNINKKTRINFHKEYSNKEKYFNSENKSCINEENINFITLNKIELLRSEIDFFVNKIYVEDNSLNSRIIRIEDNLKEIEQNIKKIEENFLITKFDMVKVISNGDWRILLGVIVASISIIINIFGIENITTFNKDKIDIEIQDSESLPNIEP